MFSPAARTVQASLENRDGPHLSSFSETGDDHSFVATASPIPLKMDRMRVALLAAYPLHLVPGFEQEQPRGHYATWLPQLAERFAGEGEFDFHWVTVTRRVNHPAPVRWMGQTFHTVYVPEKMRSLRLYWRDLRLIQRLLDGLEPALLHAWGTEDCYGLAAIRSRRRFLLSMQGMLSVYVQRSRSPMLAHWHARIERYILARTRFATAESTWGCDLLKQQAPHAQVFPVEYGVQPVFYQTSWKPDPLKPVALFVGTVDHRKGAEDAIAAFGRPELQNAELWILGDRGKGLAKKLERRSSRNVQWLGRRDRAETAELMSRGWCLVLPTRADTSPNVVKEARVIGLPVITTRHGGQADYIVDAETGWLVEPGDIDALTGRLADVLGHFDQAQRLGACRHQEHRAWFRPENTAGGFLKIYRQLHP
jgi:glycosyltransferase involved in cell wall biosynthesis